MDAFIFASTADSWLLAKIPWLGVMANKLSQVLSVRIEQYIWFDYLPTKGRMQDTPLLKGALRRRGVDPVSRQKVAMRMETLGGSARITSKAMRETAWHSTGWRRATVLKYDELSKHKFQGARQLSVSMGPGSYVGESTLVGVIYNPNSGSSAILPTKAGAVWHFWGEVYRPEGAPPRAARYGDKRP